MVVTYRRLQTDVADHISRAMGQPRNAVVTPHLAHPKPRALNVNRSLEEPSIGTVLMPKMVIGVVEPDILSLNPLMTGSHQKLTSADLRPLTWSKGDVVVGQYHLAIGAIRIGPLKEVTISGPSGRPDHLQLGMVERQSFFCLDEQDHLSDSLLLQIVSQGSLELSPADIVLGPEPLRNQDPFSMTFLCR